MNQDQFRRLDVLTHQLTELLMSAAICAKEIGDIARGELHDHAVPNDPHGQIAERRPHEAPRKQRPLLDESTLSVIWKGKTLHLGHTVAFRLLGRLARCPNQYVTHLDLLCDVWDDEDLATATIRSVVRHLRRRLRDGGMADLAIAIRGHSGRYILVL